MEVSVFTRSVCCGDRHNFTWRLSPSVTEDHPLPAVFLNATQKIQGIQEALYGDAASSPGRAHSVLAPLPLVIQVLQLLALIFDILLSNGQTEAIMFLKHLILLY